jgi:hypothetical protein
MTARSFQKNLSEVPANDARNDFKAKEHGVVLLPDHPSLPTAKQSERFWISAENTVTLMQRKKIHELKDWILINGAQKGALYVHGLQGVGKSHALYYIVCLLRTFGHQNTRVIYIPDCANWGEGDKYDWYYFLRDSVIDAFCLDQEVLEMCKTSDISEIRQLFKNKVPKWCLDNKIHLYAIIDQHNSLSDNQRQQEPFRSLEQTVSSTWKSYRATLVLSASANNHYYLKIVITDGWVTHFLLGIRR